MRTSAGPIYIEADYDGVHVTRFDERGVPSQWFDLEEPYGVSFPTELQLDESEANRLSDELSAALAEEGEDDEPFGWGAVVFLLGFVSIWVFGLVVLVYLIVRAIT
jgi:hypothetical protein